MDKVSDEIPRRISQLSSNTCRVVTEALDEAFAGGWKTGAAAARRESGRWSAPYDTLPEEIYHNGALYRLVRGEDKRPLRTEQDQT